MIQWLKNLLGMSTDNSNNGGENNNGTGGENTNQNETPGTNTNQPKKDKQELKQEGEKVKIKIVKSNRHVKKGNVHTVSRQIAIDLIERGLAKEE